MPGPYLKKKNAFGLILKTKLGKQIWMGYIVGNSLTLLNAMV